MATPYDALVRVEGIQAINGPASVNAVMLDGVTSANFEGIWVPWQFVKQGSLEISGSMSTLSCQLYGTNAAAPLNSYVATIGGTVATGHTVTLVFAFPQQSVSVSYVTTGGDTATTVAAALVAAILASATLVQYYGMSASNVAGAITATWPSISPGIGGAAGGFQSTSSPPVAPFLILTGSSTGAETVTVAAGTGGSALGSAITALGMTQFTFSARWLKIRVTTLTGGGATINAVAQGTA